MQKLKSEEFELKQKKSRLVDALLEKTIDKSLFDEKSQEIEDSLKEIQYKISVYGIEIEESSDYESRIEKFRKLLTENQGLEEFDRAIFESVIKNIVIGGYDEFGNADPAIITFVYKSGVCDKESAIKIGNRESIVIKEEYADDEPLCQGNGTGNRLEELPSAVEMFNFKFPYKHMVFVKRENKIDKVVKNQCEVRVSISV